MMSKVKVALMVLVLSGLIWVFAERAVLQTITVPVEIGLVQPGPDVLVQWVGPDGKPIEVLETVRLTVEGPTGPIQGLEEGRLSPRPLVVDVSKWVDIAGMDSNSKSYNLRVLDMLERGLGLEGREGALAVVEAQPADVTVLVTRLVLKSLLVKVYDASGTRQLTVERIEPKELEAYVEPGAAGEVKVLLSGDEELRARSGLISVLATAPSRAHLTGNAVQVKLAAGGESLVSYGIDNLKLGYLWPQSMDGKYKVVLVEASTALDAYKQSEFLGTDKARKDFEEQEIHLILEVEEADRDAENPSHSLRYNIPEGLEGIEITNRVRDMVHFNLEKIAP